MLQRFLFRTYFVQIHTHTHTSCQSIFQDFDQTKGIMIHWMLCMCLCIYVYGAMSPIFPSRPFIMLSINCQDDKLVFMKEIVQVQPISGKSIVFNNNKMQTYTHAHTQKIYHRERERGREKRRRKKINLKCAFETVEIKVYMYKIHTVSKRVRNASCIVSSNENDENDENMKE